MLKQEVVDKLMEELGAMRKGTEGITEGRGTRFAPAIRTMDIHKGSLRRPMPKGCGGSQAILLKLTRGQGLKV